MMLVRSSMSVKRSIAMAKPLQKSPVRMAVVKIARAIVLTVVLGCISRTRIFLNKQETDPGQNPHQNAENQVRQKRSTHSGRPSDEEDRAEDYETIFCRGIDHSPPQRQRHDPSVLATEILTNTAISKIIANAQSANLAVDTSSD